MCIQIQYPISRQWVTPIGRDCEYVAGQYKHPIGKMGDATKLICDLMLAGFCCLFMLGCGSAEIVSPEIAEQASGLTAFGQKIETKQDAILKAVKDNDNSIRAVWIKLEALDLTLAALKPQTGKDGDPKISPPESPAKANTQTPVQVATPGTSQESLVELASRLYARGVNVHNRTEDELKAIDAQMNGGQPVTGAIFPNNRASAVTSQRNAVRFVPRGSSFVQWPNYSTQSTCGPNGCTPRRSR